MKTRLAAILSGTLLLACNHRPDMPCIPDEPAVLVSQDTHSFTAVTTDPDADRICYRFDWGDGDISQFGDWAESGQPDTMSHAWQKGGIYFVMAEAKDEHGAQSGFGPSLEVLVDRYPAPADPFGPTLGVPGALYAFRTFLDCPTAGRIRYSFDWGGETDTSSWYDSGSDTATMTHRWMDEGTYTLRVRAMDANGIKSPWSRRHEISIDQALLLVWRYETGGMVKSSPAVRGDGVVLVGSRDGCLHAVTSHGTGLWTCCLEGFIDNTPAVGPDGTVYIGKDEVLVGIGSDGTMLWVTDSIGKIRSSAAVSRDSAVYVGSSRGFLHAWNPEGAPRWRYEAFDDLRSSPSVNLAGVIHVGCDNGQLLAIHEYCFLKWRFECSGHPRTSPAIASDGTVYFGTDEGKLYAVNEEGALRWHYDVGGDIRSSPVVGPGGTVYFGSDVGSLYALDSAGLFEWAYKTGNKVQSTPAIASDGTVYFGSDDDWVYAVNSDGTLKWRFKTGGDVYSSPAIGPDGTIYIGSDDHFLYALSGSDSPADSPWPMYRHDSRRTGCAATAP